jgi:hypothetical protein
MADLWVFWIIPVSCGKDFRAKKNGFAKEKKIISSVLFYEKQLF